MADAKLSEPVPGAPQDQLNTGPLIEPVQIATMPTADGAPTVPLVDPAREAEIAAGAEQADAAAPVGVGIEGEETVWEGGYSLRNFSGRVLLRVLLTIGLIVLAVETWGEQRQYLMPLTLIVGLVVIGLWLGLLYRVMHARFGHKYRLSNRRLFVATGLFRRREDQMELLHVKDVFVRQMLTDRLLSTGTVVVVSSERELPTFYLVGVEEPQAVLDLIWHHARKEREMRTTKVESV